MTKDATLLLVRATQDSEKKRILTTIQDSFISTTRQQRDNNEATTRQQRGNNAATIRQNKYKDGISVDASGTKLVNSWYYLLNFYLNEIIILYYFYQPGIILQITQMSTVLCNLSWLILIFNRMVTMSTTWLDHHFLHQICSVLAFAFPSPSHSIGNNY